MKKKKKTRVGLPSYEVPRLVPFLSFIKVRPSNAHVLQPLLFSLSLSLFWHIVPGISISDRSYFRQRSWHNLSFPPLTLSHITSLGYPAILPPTSALKLTFAPHIIVGTTDHHCQISFLSILSIYLSNLTPYHMHNHTYYISSKFKILLSAFIPFNIIYTYHAMQSYSYTFLLWFPKGKRSRSVPPFWQSVARFQNSFHFWCSFLKGTEWGVLFS